MALTRSGRFVDNYTSKRQQYNWNPISGYKDRDVKSLEEAVESIVPFVDKVMQYAEEAKQKCRKNTKLTINESAAIYLYTMNTPFYETLNEALRGENPPALVPCTPIPEGKHVMISYDSNSQEIVSKIYHYLQLEHIPLWLNKQKETTNDLKKSLAEGVENAAVVCCFMTHDYEKSDFCQFELQYAQKRQKRIIPCMLTDVKTWNPSDWLESIIEDLVPVDFHNVSDPSIMEENVMELIYRIKYQHSTSQYIPSQVADKPSYLFELIKYEYKQNSRIERFMNPAKSFPIDQSYINLAIVETKDQQEKEKKLRDSQHNDAIIEAFENIHGTKTPIDVKDIFKTCKDKRRNVLVFGRAGIGKSTFCRYIAYQWATGIIWQKYELIALIPLRSLTADRYPILPAGANYSLIVILRKECFSFDQYLSEKDETQLQDQFHNSRILWLLDGYDEIVQNVPTYLKSLLNDQLLKTPHHIITSRPYMNTLSHSVQLEITGFTDDNISKYVKQFLDQVENEAQNLSGEDKKILSFLKRNPRIHGIAHIPINLELICSVWSNTHWPETEIETLTMTGLYDEITEWICRRYLMKQKGISTEKLKLTSKSDVYEDCKIELAFLESVAFYGMKNNSIILRPALLEKAQNETRCRLVKYPHLLNIGLLKSVNCNGTGTQNEIQKDHYFVHLSFQEYFAERKACEAFGQMGEKAARNDVIAAVITALGDIDNIVRSKACIALGRMGQQEATNDVIAAVITALEDRDDIVRRKACEVLGQMGEKAATTNVIAALVTKLRDADWIVRFKACEVLGQMNEEAATTDVIAAMITALGDTDNIVRERACDVLDQMGEKAATKKVIAALVTTMGDANEWARRNACGALCRMGEKAATNDIIAALVTALGNTDNIVKFEACIALGRMGEKAARNDVIAAVITALGDTDNIVKLEACIALSRMGEKAATNDAYEVLGLMNKKAATNDVIGALMAALVDPDNIVRSKACEAFGQMGEKAATRDIIAALITALVDSDNIVRSKACAAFGQIGEKAARNDVIAAMITALGDTDNIVKLEACIALSRMGQKEVTNDTIVALVNTLRDVNYGVRQRACQALVRASRKEVTSDMIALLVDALKDVNARDKACEVLERIGGKAATSSVIYELLCIDNYYADVAMEKILVSASSLSDMGSNTVSKLFDFWSRGEWYVRNIPREKVVDAFTCTKITQWCPIISLHSLYTGCAVTVVGKTVTIYGNSSRITFDMPSCKLCDDLADVFAIQSGLTFYLPESSRTDVLSLKRSLSPGRNDNDVKRRKSLCQ
ncbi:unnamed protein product [Adineta steineri]|uniref:Uncharacterized protein n=1 Tax=Adineta steineri TaxID=433720 RepID=A0A819GRP3_9BILA|nr:unnamed protein product [Adineta steineri]